MRAEVRVKDTVVDLCNVDAGVFDTLEEIMELVASRTHEFSFCLESVGAVESAGIGYGDYCTVAIIKGNENLIFPGIVIDVSEQPLSGKGQVVIQYNG